MRVRRRRKPTVSRQVQKNRGAAMQEEHLSPKGASKVAPAISHTSNSPAVQTKVGLEDTKRQVDFNNYKQLGVNFSYEMLGMVVDPLKRTFKNTNEFHDYVAGSTDHIGEVPSKNFWVRLDKSKFHVIGEEHQNPAGNFVDIVKAVGTERFMYEPFHDATGLQDTKTAKNRKFGYTTGMLSDKKDQDHELGAKVGKYDPSMENIAVKTMPIYHILRKITADLRANPGNLSNYKGQGKKGYSVFERVAHYFRYAVSMAADVLSWQVDPSSAAYKFGAFYQKNQALLGLMALIRQFGGPQVHIGDMLFKTSSADLDTIDKFSELGFNFVQEYLLQLAQEKGDKSLEKIAKSLKGKVDKDPFGDKSGVNKAREWFMVENLKRGKPGGYLLAGMGDAHRENLQKPHKKLADSWHEAVPFLEKSTKSAARKYDKFKP